ncbi:MAG: ATP-dependent dethiobiotin synthetase BioD [Acidimicrobiales bacterium]
MSRPTTLIGVVGTGTEVGKTWVTAQVIGRLRASGHAVAARKPAQSFEAAGTSGAPVEPTDAEVLGAASGEDPRTVCPDHRWYPVAMAPPMAADVLGRPRITVAELTGEVSWDADTEIGFVETAGGVLSPVAHDGSSLDLVRAVGVDRIVLVADAGLGTINSVRLTLAALEGFDTVVVLNRYDSADDLHRRNRAWLVEAGVDPIVDLTRIGP